MSRLKSTLETWLTVQMSRCYSVLLRWLYTAFAWAYDLVAASVSLGRWQKWVMAILPATWATPVLEIGFGPGHLLEALKQIDPNVYGIDTSRQMCSLTSKRLLQKGHDPNISRASSEGIPFASHCFSTIFSTFPAPYIFSEATAREILRVIKPGGVLVVLLSVRMKGSSLPERLIRFLFRWTTSQPISQQMIDTLFTAMVNAGLSPSVDVIQFGNDELVTIKIIKRQLSNS